MSDLLEELSKFSQVGMDPEILHDDDLDSCCDKCASLEHSTKDHSSEEDVPVL